MSQEVPDTASLEELAIAVVTSIYGEAIAARSRTSFVVVRFIRHDRGEPEEMSYTSSVGEFRRLAALKKATMQIDDGSGGLRVYA